MSSDEYCVKNIYKYSRKAYKSHGNSLVNDFTEARDAEVPNDGTAVVPMCSCDMDSKGIFDDILHKKCPIIALAHQQRQRIIDETDRIFYDNLTHSRSLYEFLIFFRDVVIGDNRRVCIQGILLVISFIMGILFGSASCGTHLRKFNSPVFACIDDLLSSVGPGKTSDDNAIY